MDGILGIGVPSGPINLSSSQETGRTALPSGFKRAEGRPQKGNTGVAIRASVVLASVPALFRGYPSRLEWIPASLSISCSPTTLPPDKLINAHLRTRFPLLPFARDTFRNFHSRLVGFRNSFKLSRLLEAPPHYRRRLLLARRGYGSCIDPLSSISFCSDTILAQPM